MKIIDDFIPTNHQDELENALVLSSNFPWYFNMQTGTPYQYRFITEALKDSPQFTHTFITDTQEMNSGYITMLNPVISAMSQIDAIDTSKPLRIKANITLRDAELKNTHSGPHIDIANQENFITCIYYVNDSDGDTLFFNHEQKIETRVTPKKGRLVYFSGGIVHAKEAPQQTTARCVINFNFMAK